MLLLCGTAASAEVAARLEVGVAQPLTAPARDWFGTGFDVSVAGGYRVLPFLEVGARVAYVFVSRRSTSPFGPASLIALGPMLRIHRPSDNWWRPFGELSLQYVRTGSLDRLGFHVGAGVHFDVGPLSVGPWLGVQQVFRLSDAETYPTRDATVFVGGLSVELTFLGERKKPAPAPTQPPRKEAAPPRAATAPADPDGDGLAAPADRCPNLAEDRDGWEDDDGCPDADDDGDGVLDSDDICVRVPGTAATHGCPDRDVDGVADVDDRCPDTRGEPGEFGCPAYRDVKVRGTRLELSRSIDFDRKSSAIPPASGALLSEAARALLDRGPVCVHVIGHGDSTGKASANAALAAARGDNVRVFLMSKGISPSRITATGAAGPPFADAQLELVPCEVKAP